MSPKTVFAKASEALTSDGFIDRKELRKWIETADLHTLGVLHALIRKRWNRIQPSLTMKEACDLDRQYFFECITKNPKSSNYMDNRYEAAWSMEKWFRYLVSQLPETEKIIDGTVQAITDFYLSSNPDIQLAIINGFLEHIFETPSLRAYFAHWEANARLAEGYKWALMWGKDHETTTLI